MSEGQQVVVSNYPTNDTVPRPSVLRTTCYNSECLKDSRFQRQSLKPVVLRTTCSVGQSISLHRNNQNMHRTAWNNALFHVRKTTKDLQPKDTFSACYFAQIRHNSWYIVKYLRVSCSYIDYTHSTLLVTRSCFGLWKLTDNQNLLRTTRNYNLVVRGTTPFIFLTQTLMSTIGEAIHSDQEKSETVIISNHKKAIPFYLSKTYDEATRCILKDRNE